MKICVVGGGAAGMLAAILQAEQGHEVTICEKNEKLGKKLFITGKGRCNFTNDTEVEDLLRHVISNPKFLYSAFYGFDARRTIKYFEELGLRSKTERGQRVFPASDHSSDVISVLATKLRRLSVTVCLNTEVLDLLVESGELPAVTGVLVRTEDGQKKRMEFDRVVIATGGLSYPRTGSTGDGFVFAKKLGLAVSELRPALVPLETKEDWCKSVMGLSLKNVRFRCYGKKKGKEKLVYEEFGEMLFTHFGVSGPLVLSASSYLGPYLADGVRAEIDLKPALSREQLDARLLRDFEAGRGKNLSTVMQGLLPKKLIPVALAVAKLPADKRVSDMSQRDRAGLIDVLKGLPLTISGFRGYDEAIITQGGVCVKEINPKTMEAKRVKNLAFIGEVLDVDALTGGFNLQIAWSTAAALDFDGEQNTKERKEEA